MLFMLGELGGAGAASRPWVGLTSPRRGLLFVHLPGSLMDVEGQWNFLRGQPLRPFWGKKESIIINSKEMDIKAQSKMALWSGGITQ